MCAKWQMHNVCTMPHNSEVIFERLSSEESPLTEPLAESTIKAETRNRIRESEKLWRNLHSSLSLLIGFTNLFVLSDSRCLSGKKLDSPLDGAVVAFSLRTYKFLSSPPGAAFFGVLPMATTAISGVPISRARLNSFLSLYPTLLCTNATSPYAISPS